MTLDLATQLVVSGILLGGLYALISVGLTLIFGVLRLINFAHGEVLMLGMYAVFWLWQIAGWDPYLAIVPATLLVLGLGLVVGRAIILPTIGKPHVIQVFATMGLSLGFQHSAQVLWQADYRSVRVPWGSVVLQLGPIILGAPRLTAFAVAMVSTALLFLFMQRTDVGRAIRSTAQDRYAAALMGVDVSRIYLLTFALGSATLGVAAGLLVPIYAVYPSIGTEFIMVAFVVVVLGGLGSLPGALLAGLLIGVVETVSGFYIGSSMKQAVYFALFILVLVVRPNGFFGVKGAEVLD